MKMIEILRELKSGDVVPKSCLHWLKMKGHLWDYSKYGYLESLRIRCKSEFGMEFDLVLSSKGTCKMAEDFEGSMYERWRQRQARCEYDMDELYQMFGGQYIEIEGMLFIPQYFDGCFKPFLVKK